MNRAPGPLELSYEIYAWDLSVRGAHLDATHAYFNGTSVFMRVEGQDRRPCRVEIRQLEGERYANWRVATSMTRAEAPEWGFGVISGVELRRVDRPSR